MTDDNTDYLFADEFSIISDNRINNFKWTSE